jgi:hypothetical protein
MRQNVGDWLKLLEVRTFSKLELCPSHCSSTLTLFTCSCSITKTLFKITDEARTFINAKMDIDDEDDLYAPEEPKVDSKAETATDDKKPTSKPDDLEEGEEEDEGDAAMDEDDDEDDDDSVSLASTFVEDTY